MVVFNLTLFIVVHFILSLFIYRFYNLYSLVVPRNTCLLQIINFLLN